MKSHPLDSRGKPDPSRSVEKYATLADAEAAKFGTTVV